MLVKTTVPLLGGGAGETMTIYLTLNQARKTGLAGTVWVGLISFWHAHCHAWPDLRSDTVYHQVALIYTSLGMFASVTRCHFHTVVERHQFFFDQYILRNYFWLKKMFINSQKKRKKKNNSCSTKKRMTLIKKI